MATTTHAKTQELSRLRIIALNVVVVGILWLVYSAIRGVTESSFAVARENAERLLWFQRFIGMPNEADIQQLIIGHEHIIQAANTYYIAAHFPVTVAFLVWVWVWRPAQAARVRNAFIGASFSGLLIHLAFPLAPPRMIRAEGFIDTGLIFGPNPYDIGIAKAANQLAAMPSLHVGWALLVALGVWRFGGRRFRWVVALHPIITTVVVVVTANHYWTDVIVGCALVLLAWRFSRRWAPADVSEPTIAMPDRDRAPVPAFAGAGALATGAFDGALTTGTALTEPARADPVGTWASATDQDTHATDDHDLVIDLRDPTAADERA